MLESLLHRLKRPVAIAILASAASALFPVLLLSFVRRGLEQGAASIHLLHVMQFIGLVAGLFLFGLVGQLLLAKLGARLVFEVRGCLLGYIGQMSFRDFERFGSERLRASLMKDVTAVANAFTMFPHIVYNTLLIVACLAYLLYISLPLFLALGAFLLVIVAVSVVLVRLVIREFRALRGLEDALFRTFGTLFEGAKELATDPVRRSFFHDDVVSPRAEAIRRQDFRAQRYWSLSNNWNAVIVFLSLGFVVVSPALLEGVTAADSTAFALALFFMVMPLNFLSVTMQEISKGWVAYRRLTELEELFPRLSPPSACVPHPAPRISSLHLQDLSFRYEDTASFGLGPVSVDIPAGRVTFVTGGNGSGKSTLMKVVTGLYPADQGWIVIDGNAYDATNPSAYQSYFSIVHFDFHLFEHVLDSRGLLVEDTNARFVYWRQRLRLDGILHLEDGRLVFSGLSQGQRKRAAFLTAMLEDRPIIVLDEWASDQDPEFREFFYRDLLTELKSAGKTVIVISHDLQYFDDADRLLVMSDGRLLEQVISVSLKPGASQAHPLNSGGAAASAGVT